MKARAYLLAVLPAAVLSLSGATTPPPAPKSRMAVIAYYAGDATAIGRYPTEKLTHIIYSFLHLQGARLAFDNAQSSATVAALVKLKAQHPHLKVMLSLGGWTGCPTCSQVFATQQDRTTFAASVKELLSATHTDGIDLDWQRRTGTISPFWCRRYVPPWAASTKSALPPVVSQPTCATPWSGPP
jgi:chitinase